MYQVPADHPLYRLFAGVTEQTFYVELGVADPPMIDYLTSMLVRLIHTDAIYAIHNNDGVRLDHLAEMAVEAERDEHLGQRRREIYRHMGDYSLFFVGVFPEALTSRRFRQSKDSLLNFEDKVAAATTWPAHLPTHPNKPSKQRCSGGSATSTTYACTGCDSSSITSTIRGLSRR